MNSGRIVRAAGGTIKRFREHINPCGARHVALTKPTEAERGEWCFQRYVRQLPTSGEIALFTAPGTTGALSSGCLVVNPNDKRTARLNAIRHVLEALPYDGKDKEVAVPAARTSWRRLAGLRTLLRYRVAWLPGDLVAGLVVTALLVPAEIGWLSGGSGRGWCSGRRRRRWCP